MNEITCRGCGKPESECTCNLLTTDKVKLQARIKELEALMPTNGEIRLIKTALENESMRRYGNVKKDAPIFIRLAKLQAIIEGAI
jgi:DTW domain-containing protein YfiP